MEKLRTLLNNPIMGFAPWILLSVIEGPGRVVLAAVLAGALAAVICAAGVLTGSRPKMLDVAGIVFFAALAVAAALASPGFSHWLGIWAGEISNVVIALIAGLSLAVRGRSPCSTPGSRRRGSTGTRPSSSGSTMSSPPCGQPRSC